MFTSVFLTSIYVVFPLLIYFIYMFYSKTINEKEKLNFLDLALFSSFYLSTKFGNIKLTTLFLVNIPLLIALYKRRILSSSILVFVTSLYLSNINNISFYLYEACYFVIFILTFLTTIKTINIYSVIKILFDILIIFLGKYEINMTSIYFLIAKELTMYLAFYLILLGYNKMDKIINLYKSLEEITKEKKMYQSLFKITHEIKNPLAVCKGYLDMLDIKDASKANKYINIIGEEIDRTLVLLKDFSDVSKINIKRNIMDISMLLDDVYDETNLLFNAGLKLEYIPLKKETYINGDYDRLKQVLINVIKNAKESLGKDGRVILESKITNKECIIIIRDNGYGMDKETLKNIGTPFYTTKKYGTGLGVCFSKEIVEKHDGIMTYSSKLNKGTTVKIILPYEKKA